MPYHYLQNLMNMLASWLIKTHTSRGAAASHVLGERCEANRVATPRLDTFSFCQIQGHRTPVNLVGHVKARFISTAAGFLSQNLVNVFHSAGCEAELMGVPGGGMAGGALGTSGGGATASPALAGGGATGFAGEGSGSVFTGTLGALGSALAGGDSKRATGFPCIGPAGRALWAWTTILAMVSMTAADSSDFGAGVATWPARRALSTLVRSREGAAAAWVSGGG